MTEVLRAYENLYSVGQEYCVICLRGSCERRMMPIKNLELFIKSINLPFNYIYNYQRVCWICERAAVAALRLRLAMNLSASIHNLYTLMERSAPRRADFVFQLRGIKEPSGLVQQAFEWDKGLKALRARSTLLPTEVLVVASVTPSENENQAALSDDSDEYLLSDESPPLAPPPPPSPPPNDHLSEPEIFLESVIIEDDELDPIAIKDEGTVPPPTTANPPAIVPLDKLIEVTPKTSSFLLHPIMESNGVITVPTLNAQIINGQLMTIEKSNCIVQTPRLALQNDLGYNLMTEPREVTNFLKYMNKSDIGKASVVSKEIPLHILESNICSSNSVTQPNAVPLQSSTVQLPSSTVQLQSNVVQSQSNAVQLPSSTVQLQSNAVQLPSSMVQLQSNAVQLQSNVVQLQSIAVQQQKLNSSTLMVQKNQINASMGNSGEMQTFMMGKPFSDNNIVTHSIIIDDDDGETETDNVQSEQGGKRMNDTDSRRKKDRDKQGEGPTKKRRETDWEDKIPMDVISYMDATDPNAESIFRDPGLGVISEVHSVSEEAHSGLGCHGSETNSVNSGTSAQTGNSTSAINSVRSRKKNQKETITVDSIIDSVRSRRNLRSGTISVDSIVDSVRSGLNSVLSDASSSSSQNQMLSQDSSNIQQDAGGGRAPRAGENVHQNVFVRRNQGKTPEITSGEVIDLC